MGEQQAQRRGDWGHLDHGHPAQRGEQVRQSRVPDNPEPGTPKRGGHILEDLTAFGHRARVEVIEFGGTRAVRKTFAPGRERFAAREAEILGLYGGRHKAIAPLLGAGPLHVIYEYAKNDLHLYRTPHGRYFPRALLPLHVVREAFSVLRFLHDQGIALLDFHPGNILYSRSGGLRLIDFEFAQRYPAALPSFKQCYSLMGVPRDFKGDLPESWEDDKSPYESKWHGYIGLPLDSLLHDPRPLQHARRVHYQASMTLRRPGWRWRE